MTSEGSLVLAVVRTILSWSLRSQLQGWALWKDMWWDEMSVVRISGRYPQPVFFSSCKTRTLQHEFVGSRRCWVGCLAGMLMVNIGPVYSHCCTILP